MKWTRGPQALTISWKPHSKKLDVWLSWSPKSHTVGNQICGWYSKWAQWSEKSQYLISSDFHRHIVQIFHLVTSPSIEMISCKFYLKTFSQKCKTWPSFWHWFSALGQTPTAKILHFTTIQSQPLIIFINSWFQYYRYFQRMIWDFKIFDHYWNVGFINFGMKF